MADNNKVKIWIQLADAANPIALSINPEEEENYRKAEELVNTLWKKWMNRFNGTSEDVLGRVAFQFARLYLEAYGENRQVNDFLTDLDKQLNALVGGDEWRLRDVAVMPVDAVWIGYHVACIRWRDDIIVEIIRFLHHFRTDDLTPLFFRVLVIVYLGGALFNIFIICTKWT